jgi:hypothetical protein
VEIGCHKGGTFIITVEYLARFNKIERALAVDNWARPIMHEYVERRPEVTYLTESSQSEAFDTAFHQHNSWDLILIDGDHSYKAAQQDWSKTQYRANYVAFHDIANSLCPGTQMIWHDMRQTYDREKLHQWTDQYDEVLLRMRGGIMGIGLIDQT